MPRFRAEMNCTLDVIVGKKCAAKRQQVIFLHRMPFLLKKPVEAVVSVDS